MQIETKHVRHKEKKSRFGWLLPTCAFLSVLSCFGIKKYYEPKIREVEETTNQTQTLENKVTDDSNVISEILRENKESRQDTTQLNEKEKTNLNEKTLPYSGKSPSFYKNLNFDVNFKKNKLKNGDYFISETDSLDRICDTENCSDIGKSMVLYIISKQRFEGFDAYLSRLKKGSKKEREKARIYLSKNDFSFKEDNFQKAYDLIDYASKQGYDWKFVAAQSLLESIFNQLTYGACGEIGMFHAMPDVARVIARKLGLKGNISEILLDSKKAFSINSYHLNENLKKSKTVDEALSKYNAGGGWRNHPDYPGDIRDIIEQISCLQYFAESDPEKFAKYYLAVSTGIPYELIEKQNSLFVDKGSLKKLLAKTRKNYHKAIENNYKKAKDFISSKYIAKN